MVSFTWSQSLLVAAFRWLWLLLATIVLPLIPATAPAGESITWLEVHMPPYFIQQGPHQGQGYGNAVAARIQQELPEYEHHRMVTNVIRHFDMFKRGDQVCSIGLYRTPEREQFLHFSIPSMLTMPPVLVIRKENLGQYGQNGVSLAALLQNPDFRLGLSGDRSYGAGLDAVLKATTPDKNRILFSGQELGENYLKMLLLDRLDGLLALPDEAMYHAEQMGIRDRITLVPLHENQQNTNAWMCMVGCPDTAWGRQVIDRINEVLVRIRPEDSYRQAYERWLDPELLERYRRVYDTVFLTTKP